jgi:hypothetical protein
MINFARSGFTWESHPWTRDPYYKWLGGFVGEPGQVYHVRIGLEARCQVRHLESGISSEMFLGAPCRSEYTIAAENLFQIPSGEWRIAFSDQSLLGLSSRPSWEAEPLKKQLLKDSYIDHSIDIRRFESVSVLDQVSAISTATLANELLSARCVYEDSDLGFEVETEFPIDVMNLNVADDEFQVCTGPVIVPDLSTWDGSEVTRLFVAQAAFSRFDRVEFILRREVDAAPEDREWLDVARGRDRLELHDPDRAPEGYPPARHRPTVYNEVWDMHSKNAVLRADGA